MTTNNSRTADRSKSSKSNNPSAFSVFGILLVPLSIGILSGFSTSIKEGFIMTGIVLVVVGMFVGLLYAFKD